MIFGARRIVKLGALGWIVWCPFGRQRSAHQELEKRHPEVIVAGVLAKGNQLCVEVPDSQVKLDELVIDGLDFIAQLLVVEGEVDDVSAAERCCHQLDQALQLGVTPESAAAPISGGHGNMFGSFLNVAGKQNP